jgi:hypothetical protein
VLIDSTFLLQEKQAYTLYNANDFIKYTPGTGNNYYVPLLCVQFSSLKNFFVKVTKHLSLKFLFEQDQIVRCALIFWRASHPCPAWLV